MKKLIIANWKMQPETAEEAACVFGAIKKIAVKLKGVEIVICPPFIYLPALYKKLRIANCELRITLGGQDVFWENPHSGGSYTGEISVSMLKSLGVKYVILGHSERRKYLAETDEVINKKIKAVLKGGLKAILCVGEKKRDFSAEYLRFIKSQVVRGLTGISKKDLKNLVVVYEPIWAISSTPGAKEDAPESFFQMSVFIKRILFSVFGKSAPEIVPILYGGSVDAGNVTGFLAEGKADGVLVGRASWKPETFIPLLKNIK